MYVVKQSGFQRVAPESMAELKPVCAFHFRSDAINYMLDWVKRSLLEIARCGGYGDRPVFFEIGNAGVVVAIVNEVQANVVSFGTMRGNTDLPLEPWDIHEAATLLTDHIEAAIAASDLGFYDPITLTIIDSAPDLLLYQRFMGIYNEDSFPPLYTY